MALIRHLSRAPISEAIVDFRVARSKPVSEEVLQQARSRHDKDYPVVEERRGTEAHFELAPGRPGSSSVRDLGLQGLWLKAEDQKTIAQFRTDGFTLNRLPPYTSWLQVLPEALALWQSYVELTKPEAVTRLALRYINRIPLPRAGELDDIMTTAPKLPEGVPEIINTFASRVVLHDPKRNLNANVVQALEIAVEPESTTLLLDIDAYRAPQAGLSFDEITELLDALHDYKNELFFGSLTEATVAKFE